MFVVTSSASRKHIMELSNSFNEMLNKDSVIMAKDVCVGKPNPEPYLLACNLKKVHPHEAIVIENAPLGIQSATTAGTFCIAVNTGLLDDEILENAGARAVFKSCGTLAKNWNQILSILRQ